MYYFFKSLSQTLSSLTGFLTRILLSLYYHCHKVLSLSWTHCFFIVIVNKSFHHHGSTISSLALSLGPLTIMVLLSHHPHRHQVPLLSCSYYLFTIIVTKFPHSLVVTSCRPCSPRTNPGWCLTRVVNETWPHRPQVLEVEVYHSRTLLHSAVHLYAESTSGRHLVAVSHTVDNTTVPTPQDLAYTNEVSGHCYTCFYTPGPHLHSGC